jgi:hypothetical protein
VFVFFSLIIFGLYYTTQVALPKLVIAYTSDTPGAEPPAPSQQALVSANLKVASLIRGITGRGRTATEEFTKEEVPALLAIFTNHPKSKNLTTLQLKEGKLHMGFSWPLKTVEEYFPPIAGKFPALSSRYMVGEINFLPEIVGGLLSINITDANLNGSPISKIPLKQVNRLANSLLTEMSAYVPIESPTQSSTRKISINSISGIELKEDSLKITLSAQAPPIDIPEVPGNSPQ